MVETTTHVHTCYVVLILVAKFGMYSHGTGTAVELHGLFTQHERLDLKRCTGAANDILRDRVVSPWDGNPNANFVSGLNCVQVIHGFSHVSNLYRCSLHILLCQERFTMALNGRRVANRPCGYAAGFVSGNQSRLFNM
jgi:hypothetical protein